MRSLRSAISETGTAMSREQEAQTSAFKAFSCVQNGQSIVLNSGRNLQDKACAADPAVGILDVYPNHVIANRNFGIWNVNAGRLHKRFDARRQIDVGGP